MKKILKLFVCLAFMLFITNVDAKIIETEELSSTSKYQLFVFTEMPTGTDYSSVVAAYDLNSVEDGSKEVYVESELFWQYGKPNNKSVYIGLMNIDDESNPVLVSKQIDEIIYPTSVPLSLRTAFVFNEDETSFGLVTKITDTTNHDIDVYVGRLPVVDEDSKYPEYINYSEAELLDIAKSEKNTVFTDSYSTNVKYDGIFTEDNLKKLNLYESYYVYTVTTVEVEADGETQEYIIEDIAVAQYLKDGANNVLVEVSNEYFKDKHADYILTKYAYYFGGLDGLSSADLYEKVKDKSFDYSIYYDSDIIKITTKVDSIEYITEFKYDKGVLSYVPSSWVDSDNAQMQESIDNAWMLELMLKILDEFGYQDADTYFVGFVDQQGLSIEKDGIEYELVDGMFTQMKLDIKNGFKSFNRYVAEQKLAGDDEEDNESSSETNDSDNNKEDNTKEESKNEEEQTEEGKQNPATGAFVGASIVALTAGGIYAVRKAKKNKKFI